jgi:predicted ribosomally synthesized peptide with nif11-like leader
MVSDAVSGLLDEAGRDPLLADALRQAPTVEDAVRVAAEHGIVVTAEQLQEVSAPGQLSDADLELVASGAINQIFPTAPWVAC